MNPACSAARNQVTVLGINSLFGKVVSFLLKQSPVANRLVLYDEIDIGVAHDIAEIPTPCKVVVYNGEEQLRCAVKNSDVILIGDKDDFLANEDEAIRRKAADIIKYANAISSMAPNAIVLIAATPVNSLLPLFTEVQIGSGTFDGDKVMGVTSADTMRASTLLARHMRIEPEKAYLPVIGGSSADTRIPLFSQSRPNLDASKSDLKNLTRVVKMTENELKKMLNRGEALNKAYATVQLIDSVMSALRGQRNISEIVLSRTCLVPNVDYFSLPVILGRRGIAHRFPLPSLTERESILLEHAVKHIEIDKMKGINALTGKCCIPQGPEVSQKYTELITEGCPKDFVGSLMEKFKLGECSEVCEPRVEYKLLSKVKLKLPPEPTPSEMPKRTKFIEPDTPPQDGCCPLKLPCPPIPPIRGLNQIQAKHTCKITDKPKAPKCFFPPVEKSLIPCKLCPSSKACADYADYKTFFEEHSHCCGPISSALEGSGCSDIAVVSAGTMSTNNPTAAHHNYSVQPVPQVNSNVLHIGPGEAVRAEAHKAKPIDVQAVWEYPSTDRALNPESKSMPAVAQQRQLISTNVICSQGYDPSPQFQTNVQNSQQFASDQKKFEPRSTVGTASQDFSASISNMKTSSTANHTTPQTSIQSGIIQHEDPSWPFKCSTSLCLDILAPQQPGNQFVQEKSVVPQDHISNPSAPKQTALHNMSNMSTSPQNPNSDQPVEQNTTASNQREQRKKYYYNSGLSLTNPQETIERISKNPLGKEEEIRPVECASHCGHQAELNQASSVGIHGGQSNSCVCLMRPSDDGNAQIERTSSASEESKNLAPWSPQMPPDHHFNTVSSNRHASPNAEASQSTEPRMDKNNQEDQNKVPDNYRSGINPTNPPEGIVESKGETGSYSIPVKSPGTPKKNNTECKRRIDYKALDERTSQDEKVRRRMYANLKVIEDIKSEPKPSTSTNKNSIGLSLSQHFMAGPDPKIIRDTGDSSGNSMLSILRERAKAINANMELQRDLRACLERSKQKRRKDTLGLGDLIDTINPAKRLTKRLESRPALRKSYQGLRQLYKDPKYLGNQGKTASILIRTKQGHEEKSLVIVKDAKEHKKLSSRVEKIKERIQEALKKIIYPTPSESKPMTVSSIQQRLNHKLMTRPAMRKSTKAKQDFFVQLRKTDPAYRPTTSIYAPKCPTRLLYDDHPKNHSYMITFNNVIENETVKAGSSDHIHKGAGLAKDIRTVRDTQGNSKGLNLPDLPNFPELILKDMESKAIHQDVRKSNTFYSKVNTIPRGVEPKWTQKDEVGRNEVHTQNRNSQGTRSSGLVHTQGDYVKHFDVQVIPNDAVGHIDLQSQKQNPQYRRSSGPLHFQGDYATRFQAQLHPNDEAGSPELHSHDQNPQETRSSGPVRIRGDYVKHFDTQLLPKDLTLPEWIKAAIRERRRNVATPGPKVQRFNDMRYRMTSPNRLTYPRKHN